MKKRLFTDLDVQPTGYLLEKHLGDAMRFYRTIASLSGKYRRQWQFNRGNGWILRVHDTGKVLYYLIAFEEGIEISLTVRDAEREDFLNCAALEDSYPQLIAATKYPGGYALRFEIENDVACTSVSHFLSHFMRARMPFDGSLPPKSIKLRAESKHKLISSK